MDSVNSAKEAVRDLVWSCLIESGAAPPDSRGKIPAFAGARAAAGRVAELKAWRHAATVKANPDFAQISIRALALSDGKLLYMAVPAMKTPQPFYLLDPHRLGAQHAESAADKDVAARVAQHVGLDEMRPIDVVVCGSVAVNRAGARVGKGAGYSDLEVALLIEAGLVTSETVIISSVHQLQVVDEPIPESAHDFRVDYIVTPNETIRCPNPRRPRGIAPEDLTAEQIATIPVLRARGARAP